MENGLIIIGNSEKGATYEEEKRFFSFYCNHEPGEEFEFKDLLVVSGVPSPATILKGAILKAPDEHTCCFTFRSEPYQYCSIIKNPCKIPKFIVPFSEGEEIMVIAMEALKQYRLK